MLFNLLIIIVIYNKKFLKIVLLFYNIWYNLYINKIYYILNGICLWKQKKDIKNADCEYLFCTEIIQFVEGKGQIYKQLNTEELTIAIKRISDRVGVEKIIHINLEEHLLVIC